MLRSFGGAWAQWISASERVRMSAEMPGEEVADMTIELPDEPWEIPLPGDVLAMRGDGANRVAVANGRKS